MDADRRKPLDAGTGRVCASFDPESGAWLSIGTPHPRHGFVELSAVPPFDEAGRGNARATRAHRLALTRPEHAFLAVRLDGAPPALAPDLDSLPGPAWQGACLRVTTHLAPDATVIGQRWDLEGSADGEPRVEIRLRGTLDRPALAEVTETDPPAPVAAVTMLRPEGPGVLVEAPALDARLRVAIGGGSVEWTDMSDEVIGRIRWPAGARRRSFEIQVGLDAPPARSAGPGLPGSQRAGDRLTARALEYVRGCTTLRTGPDERTILTDHRILPLSWTRDAYWQGLALLAADGPGDRDRVADHLRWLWRRCDRAEGWWARSHHADGRRKDLAHQADQQLYPIVELADFWRLTGRLPGGVEWSEQIRRAWQASESHVDAATGLLESSENAADDPASAPFIGASQILRWWTARRLAEMAEAGVVSLDARSLREAARAARAAFASAFERGDEPWPYAVDARGRGHAYHDANDLPVVLAPTWGFCRASDPGWRATMSFAFSPANPGWVAGRRPGLGSAHTPGVWTLGDLQAWIHARTVGDAAAADRALQRLEHAAFPDGMLPEAYDPDDGAPIRHWFAWPGAATAALRLLDRDGRIEAQPGPGNG